MAVMGLERQWSWLTAPRTGMRQPLSFAILNVVLIWTLALLVLWQDYRQSVEQWKAFTATFALAIAAHVQDTQVAAQLVLRSMSNWIREENIQNEQQFREIMAERRFFDDMKEYTIGLPQIGEALIVAADGDVLNSTLAFPARRSNLADHDIVKSAAAAWAAQPGLSATDKAAGNDRSMFYISRRVEAPAGEFLGIVAVGVDAESFASFVRRVPLAPDSWGSLLRADGTLLASSVANDEVLGRRFENARSHRLFKSGQSGKPEFTHEPVPFNPRGSPAQIVVATAIEGLPAYVSVSVGESAFLVPLRSDVYWVVGIALLLTAMTVVACLRALRLIQRVAAAHRADAERQVLAAIVDSPSALTAVIDRSGRVVHCNARFRELLAVDGETAGALANPAIRGAAQITAFAAGSGPAGAEADLEFEAPNRNVRILHFTLSRQALVDTGECVILVGQDETERRQVQRAMALSAKLVTLGEITTSIAHEVTQPLNVIHMSAQNALTEINPEPMEEGVNIRLPLPEAEFRQFVVEKLRRIVRQVERASEIISHMRIFGRESTEKLARFDMRDACRNAIALLSVRFTRNDIAVREEFPGEPLIVNGYRLILEQAMVYLLRNAVEALEKTRTVEPTITVSLRNVPGDRLVLRISDNGLGIPPSVRERIFEPFFTTKAAEKHPGLGLAIVYGIVRDAGGSIRLVDTGTGATFEIELPQSLAA